MVALSYSQFSINWEGNSTCDNRQLLFQLLKTKNYLSPAQAKVMLKSSNIKQFMQKAKALAILANKRVT